MRTFTHSSSRRGLSRSNFLASSEGTSPMGHTTFWRVSARSSHPGDLVIPAPENTPTTITLPYPSKVVSRLCHLIGALPEGEGERGLGPCRAERRRPVPGSPACLLEPGRRPGDSCLRIRAVPVAIGWGVDQAAV